MQDPFAYRYVMLPVTFSLSLSRYSAAEAPYTPLFTVHILEALYVQVSFDSYSRSCVVVQETKGLLPSASLKVSNSGHHTSPFFSVRV